jgi:hypothetical protein
LQEGKLAAIPLYINAKISLCCTFTMESNLLFLKLFNEFCYVLVALAIDQYIVNVNNDYQRGAHEQAGVKF